MITKVVELSGESHHAIVEPSSNSEDAVSGTVFEITEQSLAAARRKWEQASRPDTVFGTRFKERQANKIEFVDLAFQQEPDEPLRTLHDWCSLKR